MNFSVCVCCGAKNVDPQFHKVARDVGRNLALHEFRVISGGGTAGLMQELGNGVLEKDGELVSVLTEHLLNVEGRAQQRGRLIVAQSMHERKALMSQMADAFLVLPGGLGTLEEMLEVLSHLALKIMSKPLVILNIGGYYGPLFEQILRGSREGFISESCVPLRVVNTVVEAVGLFVVAAARRSRGACDDGYRGGASVGSPAEMDGIPVGTSTCRLRADCDARLYRCISCDTSKSKCFWGIDLESLGSSVRHHGA